MTTHDSAGRGRIPRRHAMLDRARSLARHIAGGRDDEIVERLTTVEELLRHDNRRTPRMEVRVRRLGPCRCAGHPAHDGRGDLPVASAEAADRLAPGHPDQGFGATSFAQFGEDLLLCNLFNMLGIVRPSYLDVGAHHPFDCSNTALLHLLGSRGVNVEANAELAAAFAVYRPEDVTLNVGIGPAPGVQEFHMIDPWSGRNTFHRATAEAFIREHPSFTIRRSTAVEIRTLRQVVDEHCGGRFPALLSLDIEGSEIAVLESTDFGAAGPVAICIEAVSGDDTDVSQHLLGLMRDRGYLPWVRTIGNVLFVEASAARRVAPWLATA